MTSSQLNLFLKAAETKSFSEAAKAYSVSRSAVTQSIRSLEKELGYDLFEKGLSKTRLTEAGAFLYPRLLSACRQAEQAIREASAFSVRKSQIRVGFFYGLQEKILQEAFSAFMKNHTDYDVSFHPALLADLFLDWEKLGYDLIIVPEPSFPFPDRYHPVLLMTAGEQCVVPITHPFAAMEQITPEMLTGEILILPSTTASIQSNIEMRDFLKPYRESCRCIESPTPGNTELLSIIHNGFAIKPAFTATNSQHFVCVPFICPVKARLYLLTNPNCSQAARQFMEDIKNDH